MPERAEPATRHDQAGEAVQKELAERTERARNEFASIFDLAEERGVPPSALYVQESTEED